MASFLKLSLLKLSRQLELLQGVFVQSVKILLLPPKYEIIMVPSNNSFFQYCYRNIGLISIASCKVITLISLRIIFGISSFFYGSLSKVIALKTIAIVRAFTRSIRTVGENIIATTKIRNNYGAIK